jgi:4-amino-4-deoxy-L-arabinose transferase-like glycosyltransferase
MPDIGLLQGGAPRPRIIPPLPVPAAEDAPHIEAAASAREIAAPFLAPVDSAIAVVTAVVSAPLGDRVTETVTASTVTASAMAASAVTANTVTASTDTSMAASPPESVTPVARGGKGAPAIPTQPAGLPPIRASDLLWLALALFIIVGTGLGIRDPWPADEPRFAALARDMALSHEWLFPRVGGDLYQDKPPLYFWLLAICYTLFGSVKASFLIPSFLAAGGTLFLIYDFGRRMVSRGAGLAAAMISVCTLQFFMVMRGAQIDATLCFLTTLSLYALLRHLLLGPAWRWYFIGGFVAGLGVFTKGVGFLPVLVLIPYFSLRALRWNGMPPIEGGAGGWRWWLAPFAMLLAISFWFVPMLLTVAASGSAEYAAYRDEILFKQTVGRYAAAWHHVKAWYYFIVEVIPSLWLPWSLLLFWLVPRFKTAFQARDARVWLPLCWLFIVLLFFSASPGKRGVYILPALPALAIASLPFLDELLARASVRRIGFVLGGIFFLGAAVLALAHTAGARFAVNIIAAAHLASAAPLYLYLVLCGAGLAFAYARAPLAAWPVALGSLAIVFSYFIAPAMNAERSGGGFVRAMLTLVNPEEELALVGYKEQFLLYLDRPTVNFGHRRWLEGPQESYDASAWLNAAPHRVLLVPGSTLKPCFPVNATEAGRSSDDDWFLIRGPASADCASKGDALRAIRYAPNAR